jgi:hypothetical protein
VPAVWLVHSKWLSSVCFYSTAATPLLLLLQGGACCRQPAAQCSKGDGGHSRA